MYGKPQRKEILDLQKIMKRIDKMDSWREFYRIIGIFKPNDKVLVNKLRRAVENSEDRGYHSLEELKITKDKHKQNERYGKFGWFGKKGWEVEVKKNVSTKDDGWFKIEKSW